MKDFCKIEVDQSTNSVDRVTSRSIETSCRSIDKAAPKCKLARSSSENEINTGIKLSRGFQTWAARFHHEDSFLPL
jgi:hypothetical protein